MIVASLQLSAFYGGKDTPIVLEKDCSSGKEDV
jgi:hypothetical protein